jgi:S1-C subfamily serine protease
VGARVTVAKSVQLKEEIKELLLSLYDLASQEQAEIPAYVGRVLYERAAFLEAKYPTNTPENPAVESQPERKSWWLRAYFRRRDNEYKLPASTADKARCAKQIKPYLERLVEGEDARVLLSPNAPLYGEYGRVYASVKSQVNGHFEIVTNLDAEGAFTIDVDIAAGTISAKREDKPVELTLHHLKVLYKELGMLASGEDTEDITELEQTVRESTVKIHTRDGQGSGVIVFDLNVGLHVVVTNSHVVEGDSIVIVEPYDGKSLNGYVVAQCNQGNDLAAIIVDSAGCSYQPAQFSDSPEAGDRVFFGGYPTTFSKADLVLKGGSHLNLAHIIEPTKPLSPEVLREGYSRAARCADWNSGGSGGGVFLPTGELVGVSGACVPYEDVGIVEHLDTDPYGIDLFIESQVVQQFLFNQVLKLVE